MRLPKTLLMDTLILNLKPFLSESSNKVVPQNIFPKAAVSSKYFPKAVFTKKFEKKTK